MIDQSYFFKLNSDFNHPSSQNRIGIAVIRTRPNAFHSALLIIFNNQFILMHLTEGFSIVVEDIKSLDNTHIYCVQWITNLEQSTIDYMIIDFINIYQKYKNSIPYAPLYNPNHSYFTENLTYIGKLGFSCSSFIFHTFSRRKINFIDIESWKISPETLVWQQKVIESLDKHTLPDMRKTLNTEDFIAELKTELGVSPRISPDELSASGYFYIQENTSQNYDFIQTMLPSMHTIIDKICA